MANKRNPSANVPRQTPDEPMGDRGQGDKTWSPNQGEQGISNRADDETDRFPAGRDPIGAGDDDSAFDDGSGDEDEFEDGVASDEKNEQK